MTDLPTQLRQLADSPTMGVWSERLRTAATELERVRPVLDAVRDWNQPDADGLYDYTLSQAIERYDAETR